MLSLQQKIKHAKFISGWAGKRFRWGDIDCLQMLFGWYDYVKGTSLRDGIHGKYFDKGSAVRFWKDYKMSAVQWMNLRGFTQYSGEPAEGDIGLADMRLYPSAYIYHNGMWWGAMEGSVVNGFADLPDNSVTWRL